MTPPAISHMSQEAARGLGAAHLLRPALAVMCAVGT